MTKISTQYTMAAMRCTAALILALCFLSSLACALEGTYPYASFYLRLPGLDDPYPGLGTYFSSLGEGIDTVLWNPASLGKVKSSQGSLGLMVSNPAVPFTKNYSIRDERFDLPGSTIQTGLTNAVLFTSNQTTTTLSNREFAAESIESTQGSGVNYKQAVRVNEWLSLGLSTRGDAELAANLSGSFPATYLMDFNLLGTTNFMGSGLSIDNQGFMTYNFSGFTYTSEASVWNGFLHQTQRVPFTSQSEARNNIDIKNDLTFSGAANWGRLYLGTNFTPISAAANIDNYSSIIINPGTTDPYFYVPDFDPNNESEVLNWMRDPAKYGEEAGYKRRYIRVPAGESIGEARYRGFFSANTTRMDLGAIYDVTDFLSLGLAYENLGGAELNFKGTGRTAYVIDRISTADAGTLIDPAADTSWSPFSDTYNPMEDTENLGLLPEINVPLPKKMKIGFTLRRPWLITFDYEKNLTPFTYKTKDETGAESWVKISDVNLIRLGMETQLLFLPLWLRGGTAMLLEPHFEGLSSKNQDSVKNIFRFGFIPLKMDLGTYTNLWGTIVGGSGGFNVVSLLNILQLDVLNPDTTRFLAYNIFVQRDNWKVTYQSLLDQAATLKTYKDNYTESKTPSVEEILSWTRWIRTLTVSYNF